MNPAPAAQTGLNAPTKMLVAVHGIGDQIGYQTIQLVAERLGAYYSIAPAVPVGRFYSGGQPPKPSPTLMVLPSDPEEFSGIGFAEVYWAAIAREVSGKDKYILEESKKWARTITGRLAQQSSRLKKPIPKPQLERIVTVLDEMIDTVLVLERLTFLADKAGLFKFSLKELLADFLGDVQIVSEFAVYRQQILAEFDAVMTAALQLKTNPNQQNPDNVELYIVAHSEGSALAFLAVLTALSAPDAHPWIASLRGLMTIGSPIESHHLLWPTLWTDLKPNHDALGKCRPDGLPIPWHNYFDYGDPIAYSLSETTKWLATSKFKQYLSPKEISFSRSYVPGKAHVDYWKDDEVFGHFIENVVQPTRRREPGAQTFPNPPRTKAVAVLASYAIPQALIAAVLIAATYFLYRPVVNALNPAINYSASNILRDVVGIGVLLLGVTAAARIPRLTDRWRWWFLSAALLCVSAATYATIACGPTRLTFGRYFTGLSVPTWVQAIPPVPLRACSPGTPENAGTSAKPAAAPAPAPQTSTEVSQAFMFDGPTFGIVLVAMAVALVSGFAASWGPFIGARALPILGGFAALLLVGWLLANTPNRAALWPVVIGGALFFYLWWLGALLFDLVFVWDRYVRHGVALEMATKGYEPPPIEWLPKKMRDWAGGARTSTSGAG